MKEIKVLRLIFLLFFLSGLPQKAFATFSLSVSPYEGGYDLRYGKVNIVIGKTLKEVTVSITSDIGKQYRLIQTLLEPLTNQQGDVIPQNNYFVYALRGTNKYGTLHVEQEIPVFLGRTILYTSNTQGLSDSFTLVYGLNPINLQPGSYRGRIGFILEPIDSTQEAVNVILNVYAEVEVETAIEFNTLAGAKRIELETGKEDKQSFDVLVNIKGNLGSQFRIIQEVPELLTSPEGDQIPFEAVNLMVKEVKRGSGPTKPQNLSSRQEIYTSSPIGETESFIINYSLGNLEGQKAGRYRANIRYLLEGAPSIKTGLLDTFSLEVFNPRIFDLEVTPELGGIIRFTDLKPLQPPRIQEVIIQIKTNIKRRYQVSQNVISEFTDKEGNIIPQEYLKLRTESLETKGELKYPNKTEVKKGEMVLFISDKEGLPDSFKVIYELGIPLNIKAGDYSTRIVYTISAI